MEIPEIKSRLPLKDVLNYYGLKPDPSTGQANRINCPFHPDKTPSLQLYYKTNTCYCFSSNCPTHGKSLDVIDFIMYKEGLDKHQAILKAQMLIGGNGAGGEDTRALATSPGDALWRRAVLLKMFARSRASYIIRPSHSEGGFSDACERVRLRQRFGVQ